MLSALRSTLEDPSGAATTSGAAQEPSAPVMPQLLLAGAPPVPAYVGCVSDSDCNQVPRAHPVLRLSPDEVHGPVRAPLASVTLRRSRYEGAHSPTRAPEGSQALLRLPPSPCALRHRSCAGTTHRCHHVVMT